MRRSRGLEQAATGPSIGSPVSTSRIESPELYHAERTASLGEARRMKLLVEDAARRRHPLHVARTDDAALAGRIPVRDLAVINDSDRFKPAMRMLIDATRSR